MLTLDPAPKVITFDCYGTLVQWHRVMRETGRAILSRHVQGPVTDDEAAIFADRQRAVAIVRQQQAPFCDYKQILTFSLEQALADAGHGLAEEDVETLLAAMRVIEPHPETAGVLARLRERYRLAIISNTDDDLIAGTVAALGAPIDVVVTAQQARAYKPNHRHFQHAHAIIGVSKDETVHVAMAQYADLKICQELGIRCVWINRAQEAVNPAWRPAVELPDLSGLPGLLLPA